MSRLPDKRTVRRFLQQLPDRFRTVRRFLERLPDRLRTGRYSQKYGILVGVVAAVLLAVVGWCVGPVLAWGVSQVTQLGFRRRSLTTLWTVHATISSLSLVGLSFAWNSVRNLSTRRVIVDAAAYRLRSIETITFLLTADLLIGAGALLTTSGFVTSNVGGVVGAVLVGSVVVAVRRFWTVFDLLLHNTLDDKVNEFAENALERRPQAVEDEYPEYLGHFFDDCHDAIAQERPKQLDEQLREVEDLIRAQFDHDAPLTDSSPLWRYVFDTYDDLYRRCVEQQSPRLGDEVVKSLYGISLITRTNERTEVFELCLDCFSTLFVRSCSAESDGFPSDLYFDRISDLQRQVLSSFSDSGNVRNLSEVSETVDKFVSTHATMWRTAVESESVDELHRLREMLSGVRQFGRGEYSTYHDPEGCRGASGIPVAMEKQRYADRHRESLRHLRGASYGWALKLYREGDVSDDFINYIFSKYVTDDFASPDDLSELYFSMCDASEPLNYWERWNMGRALDQNSGPVSIGTAVSTWLLDFYCTALVWSIEGEDDVDRLREQDPAESPIVEYERVENRASDVIDRIENYRDEFPLADLLDDGPDIDTRCDALTDHLSDVVSVLEDQRQEKIRESSVAESKISKFTESVNEKVESVRLRSALDTVGEVKQSDTLEAGEGGVTTPAAAQMPRRLFADRELETFFNSSYSQFTDRVRGDLLDELGVEEREVESADDLSESLADVVSNEDVEVIVVEHVDAMRTLENDDRGERFSNDLEGSHFSFLDVPVLRDITEEFAAVALFADGFEYLEERSEDPVSVDVTPGEDVDHWDPDDLDDDQDVRDHVKVKLTYDANVQTEGEAGVVFRYAD